MKKFLSLLLALVMVFSLAACGNDDTNESSNPGSNTGNPVSSGSPSSSSNPENPGTTSDLAVDSQLDVSAIDDAWMASYDAASSAIYNEVLSEFYDLYMTGRNELEDLDLRFTLMAMAEAKLLNAAVMLPTTTQGGNYAMSRVATRTIASVLWGNDSDRYHQAIVATEPILSTDQDAMKAQWLLSADGAEYEAFVKQYLTSHGYTIKDSYSLGYTADPETWDVLATSKAADAEAIVNTYDGLIEYDVRNVMKPALATSWEVSDDGLVWTFHIREGVKWVDYQGREIGEVTADDWVAALQHMCDAAEGLEYLVTTDGGCGIVGTDAYLAGEITDFSEVGVKALDKYTLQYTLEAKAHYFDTMLSYSVFAPMNRSFYESQGGKFGADYNPEAENYVYGTSPENIAYCGPYLVTNLTEKNTIVFSANPSYWNKDNINIKTLTWLFNSGDDVLKAYNDFKSGIVDGAGLNTNALVQARQDIPDGQTETYYDLYHYTSATNATSYMAFFNLNRYVFSNTNDTSAVRSTQTVTQAERANAAMQNLHFRRALSMSLDRGTWNAASVGEELKYNALRNSYTPGDFLYLEKDVTVDVNGTSTTFPAGTFYGQIMQAQLEADGSPLKVWNDETLNNDGFDGWYNPAAAAEELAAAIEELAAQGIEVSAENPIVIDLPYASNSEVYTNRANIFKRSVEATLENKVILNIVSCVDYNEWYFSGYYTSWGYEANYDIFDLSGWGPDYGDPQTYLDTFLPNGSGYMIKCIGLW